MIKKMSRSGIDKRNDEHIEKQLKKGRIEALENDSRIALLGQEIKKSRIERCWTQSTLAEFIGVHKSQISKIEKNVENANFGLLLKILYTLGAEVNLNVNMKIKRTMTAEKILSIENQAAIYRSLSNN